jgi:outer membrane receptor protein involved in Fe transport
MKWTDIQLNARVDGPWWLRGTFNGETGESKGAEINTVWQATDNLSFEGNAYFADAKYTKDTLTPRGGLFLQAGQEMPNSPDTKFRLAVEYTVPDVAALNGDLWFRYDTSFTGALWDNLEDALDKDPAGRVPASHSSNAQIGLSMQNDWDISLMARNVWDDRGINNILRSTYVADWFGDTRFRNERTLQQPRTISLSVRKRF